MGLEGRTRLRHASLWSGVAMLADRGQRPSLTSLRKSRRTRGTHSLPNPSPRPANVLKSEPALSGGGKRECRTMVGRPYRGAPLLTLRSSLEKVSSIDLYFWSKVRDHYISCPWRTARTPSHGHGGSGEASRQLRKRWTAPQLRRALCDGIGPREA